MKRRNYLILLLILLASLYVTGQTDKNYSKFEIIAGGGIGYTNVRTERQPRYNLSANTVEIVLNYKFSKNIGIATGVGRAELSGNGFNETGEFYQERSLIKIPLLLTATRDVSEKLFVLGNFGLYAQTISRDRLGYKDFGESDVYGGWNFGFQLGLGFGYNLDEKLGAGIILSAQSDLSKLETNPDKSFTDEQKHRNLTTIGVFLKYKL